MYQGFPDTRAAAFQLRERADRLRTMARALAVLLLGPQEEEKETAVPSPAAGLLAVHHEDLLRAVDDLLQVDEYLTQITQLFENVTPAKVESFNKSLGGPR